MTPIEILLSFIVFSLVLWVAGVQVQVSGIIRGNQELARGMYEALGGEEADKQYELRRIAEQEAKSRLRRIEQEKGRDQSLLSDT